MVPKRRPVIFIERGRDDLGRWQVNVDEPDGAKSSICVHDGEP